jgi:hypothetical protein
LVEQKALMRDSQNLVVERRQQGNKMGIKKKRENGFGSSALTFAMEQKTALSRKLRNE